MARTRALHRPHAHWWYSFALGLGAIVACGSTDGDTGSGSDSSIDAASGGAGAAGDDAGSTAPDATPSACGNGVVEVGEQCDQDDMYGKSCAELGFEKGTLTCNAYCGFDTSECQLCGDGTLSGDEECEGSDVGGKTCESLGATGGKPSCVNCKVDLSGCHTCGDQVCDKLKGENSLGCWNDCGWQAGFKEIAAGGSYSCALRADGTVWCWGSGGGVGGAGPVTTIPTKVPIADVVQISVAADVGCALKKNETVWCWGANGVGQLGLGYDDDAWHATPAQVKALSSVRSISTSASLNCATKTDNTVWCWGDDTDWQLGKNGKDACPNRCSTTPLQIQGLSASVHAVAGTSRACAINQDGSVECWGSRFLGTGDLISSTAPRKVKHLTSTVQLASWAATCALAGEGTVRCWGLNNGGYLGSGLGNPGGCINGFTCASEPVLVPALSSVLSISPSCALKQDGTVWCWGVNQSGQLGIGTNKGPETCVGPFADCSSKPVAVKQLPPAARIASGYYHACAIVDGGDAWCWGANHKGQLGIGSLKDSHLPKKVVMPVN